MGSNGVHVNTMKFIGHVINGNARLPVGARIYSQQCVGIADDLGDVGLRSKEAASNTHKRNVFPTEDELGTCVSKLLDTPKDVSSRSFRKIFELGEMSD